MGTEIGAEIGTVRGGTAKKKALIVDDSENNLLLEKDLLELDSFEVFEAATATIGIATAKRENPDIIIMDVRLPDMRGTEAARIIRADPETHGIPIVFVTASVLPGGMKTLDSFPNSGFIGKPINTRTFSADVRSHLR